MNGLIKFAVVAALPAQVFAGVFGDAPDATHAWAVHDENRPLPKKIQVKENGVPSDAKVLFDGTAASIAANWCDAKGQPTKWKLDEKGELISVRGAGYIFSKEKFSDFQLHVEWASPLPVKGSGQGRGNSGVFLMGNYEIQVLDSYETDPDAKGGNKNPNYADGIAGAVYGQNPPLVNPARAPGVFNAYDIVFHAPIEVNGKVTRPASVTVFFNGVVVQDHWLFDGPTGYRKRATYARTKSDSGLVREAKMPIAFQDHGNPVHYRNVWIRELPRREANVTHGNYYAQKDATMELRRATAKKLFAKIADPKATTAANVKALAEVISYANEEPYAGAFNAALEGFRATAKDKGAIRSVNDVIGILAACGVISADKKIK